MKKKASGIHTENRGHCGGSEQQVSWNNLGGFGKGM